MDETIVKLFDHPDEVREFPKGRFETVAAFADGTIVDLQPGAVFYIPAVPHDSWVVGDQPYVSIHLQGTAHYSK